MASIELDPRLTGVVVFDMLRGYIHSGDAPQDASIKNSGIVESAARLLEAARSAGCSVFYAQADHRADGVDWNRVLVDTNYDLVPYRSLSEIPHHPHIASGTPEADITPELAPRPGDTRIYKHRWSAFRATHLDLSLRARGIDTVVLFGLSTDVGVIATAYWARDMDYRLVIARDCCWSPSPERNAWVMDNIFPRMARVRNHDEIIAGLKAVAPSVAGS